MKSRIDWSQVIPRRATFWLVAFLKKLMMLGNPHDSIMFEECKKWLRDEQEKRETGRVSWAQPK